MTLSECLGVAQFEILRDAPFDNTGFLSVPLPNMLVFLENPRQLPLLRRLPGAAYVLTTCELAPKLNGIPGVAVSPDPRRAFFQIHNHLHRHTDFFWTDFKTEIGPDTAIHPRAEIAERNVRIGPGCRIGPHVTIGERCLLGAGVVVRPGAVLGAEGFQTGRFNGWMLDMEHAGGLRVGDRAEVMANAVIARAVFRQFTCIGEDSRIGNIAFVSHNVCVGRRSFVGHGSVINGNVELGEEVWIGPGATVVNNVVIGDRASVSLGSTVVRDVPAGRRVTGNIAVSHRAFLRHVSRMERDGSGS